MRKFMMNFAKWRDGIVVFALTVAVAVMKNFVWFVAVRICAFSVDVNIAGSCFGWFGLKSFTDDTFGISGYCALAFVSTIIDDTFLNMCGRGASRLGYVFAMVANLTYKLSPPKNHARP